MKKRISITGIIVAIAALVGIIATFLPWISASVLDITVTAKGIEGDGVITLVMFIAILGLAIFNMAKNVKWVKICISVVSVLAFLVAAIKIPDALSNGFTVGIGVYLVVIAGLVSAIAPWLPIDKK